MLRSRTKRNSVVRYARTSRHGPAGLAVPVLSRVFRPHETHLSERLRRKSCSVPFPHPGACHVTHRGDEPRPL